MLPSMLKFFMSVFLENMHTLAFFFSVLCTLPFASFAEASKNPSGFSIDLIHRDSPSSPFHDSTKTPLERIRNAALRTHSRMNRVNSLSFSSSLNENQSPQHESIIIPNSGDYLMKIYIGTPPVERLVIADTGSDLNWVQCFPCRHCFPQDTPIYDPSKSSTFTNVPCDSQPCASLNQPQAFCGLIEKCIYSYSYNDESFTVGELVYDSVSFGNSTSGAVTFPEFVFGCGNHNEFTADKSGIPTGIVGLGPGPFSLVSQLGDSIGRKFSYCLLPSVSTFNSKLKFGDKGMVLGNGVVSTPLFTKYSSYAYYYLNLEGVTVGTKTMKTGGQTTNGNIIIDSGTTLTYLEPSFYDDFVTSVKEAIVGVEVVQGEDVPHPLRFCFKHDKPDMDFPNTVFHFTGANITLKTSNLFLFFEEDLLICLAVVPTVDDKSPVFGNLAQVDFQVEYDLDGKKVSFAPTDCTKN